MLNCTDLECILHHHHYYAHLHHMQHHLQNAQDQGDYLLNQGRQNMVYKKYSDLTKAGKINHDQSFLSVDGRNQGMAADGSTTDITGLLNDTDSELSGLSHLDAPNNGTIMISGVFIAMLLVALIIVLLAFTINKLRKREEHSNSVHPADVILQAPPQALAPALVPEPVAFRQQPLWQFPPPLPPPYVYSNDQDTMLQPIGNERASFRNLRKNIGGRWRRLVKRKPEQEVYTIPPELKPQLKQIYVY